MDANKRHFEAKTGYRVVPMHPAVESSVQILERALSNGLTARRDPHREGFYSAEIEGVAYYFHIFQAMCTAYLLSVERPGDAVSGGAETRLMTSCHAG